MGTKATSQSIFGLFPYVLIGDSIEDRPDPQFCASGTIFHVAGTSDFYECANRSWKVHHASKMSESALENTVRSFARSITGLYEKELARKDEELRGLHEEVKQLKNDLQLSNATLDMYRRRLLEACGIARRRLAEVCGHANMAFFEDDIDVATRSIKTMWSVANKLTRTLIEKSR